MLHTTLSRDARAVYMGVYYYENGLCISHVSGQRWIGREDGVCVESQKRNRSP